MSSWPEVQQGALACWLSILPSTRHLLDICPLCSAQANSGVSLQWQQLWFVHWSCVSAKARTKMPMTAAVSWASAMLMHQCLNLSKDGLTVRRRPHQSLAAVGVAALTRLISAAGSAMSDDTWALCVHTLSAAALDTLPQVETETLRVHVLSLRYLLLKQLRTCWL